MFGETGVAKTWSKRGKRSKQDDSDEQNKDKPKNEEERRIRSRNTTRIRKLNLAYDVFVRNPPLFAFLAGLPKVVGVPARELLNEPGGPSAWKENWVGEERSSDSSFAFRLPLRRNLTGGGTTATE